MIKITAPIMGVTKNAFSPRCSECAAQRCHTAIKHVGNVNGFITNIISNGPINGKGRNQNVFQSSKGTSHMSVIDQDGNVASLTVSNGEGCGYMVPNCGFMLNNFLGEEDINTKGFFNFDENSRMASMMSPTIIENRDDLIALGTGGSNRIKTAMFQVIWQIIAENKTLDKAINQPRFL